MIDLIKFAFWCLVTVASIRVMCIGLKGLFSR